MLLNRLLLLIGLMLLLSTLVSGCAGIPGDQGLADKKTSTLSPEEQINLATGEFLKIYKLSQAGRDANLDKMIASYQRIIQEYPEAPLAQESYWHLIQIMLEDFQPPKKDEALKLFSQFTLDYPESPLQNAVSDTVMRFLYQQNLWQDLLVLTKPYAQNIDKITAPPKKPLPLFMYSEARYHLGECGLSRLDGDGDGVPCEALCRSREVAP